MRFIIQHSCLICSLFLVDKLLGKACDQPKVQVNFAYKTDDMTNHHPDNSNSDPKAINHHLARKTLSSKAKLAMKAKRYDEMFEIMKKLASLDVELTVVERLLFKFSYKNQFVYTLGKICLKFLKSWSQL